MILPAAFGYAAIKSTAFCEHDLDRIGVSRHSHVGQRVHENCWYDRGPSVFTSEQENRSASVNFPETVGSVAVAYPDLPPKALVAGRANFPPIPA